jgi:YggT family protein
VRSSAEGSTTRRRLTGADRKSASAEFPIAQIPNAPAFAGGRSDSLVTRWFVGTSARTANTRPMGAHATFGLLADVESSLQNFVTVFVSIYILFIFGYVLLSWIRLPYSGVAATLQRFLDEVVSPYLRLFRGRIPTIGPLDLSPIVAVVVLLVAAQLVNALIGALL